MRVHAVIHGVIHFPLEEGLCCPRAVGQRALIFSRRVSFLDSLPFRISQQAAPKDVCASVSVLGPSEDSWLGSPKAAPASLFASCLPDSVRGSLVPGTVLGSVSWWKGSVPCWVETVCVVAPDVSTQGLNVT